MSSPTTLNITQLLVAWKQGDQDALAQLTPLVYRELHRLAHGYLAGERRGHVLQTTALVNVPGSSIAVEIFPIASNELMSLPDAANFLKRWHLPVALG